MKKIHFFGPYNQNTSLGIYTDKLREEFDKMGYIIMDHQRYITNMSEFQKIKKGIFGLWKMTFPGILSKNNTVIALHSAVMFPCFFLFTKAKKIHIIHDFFYYDDEHYKNFQIRGWQKWYMKYIHKFLYRIAFWNADTIVAISEATKQEILEKFWKKYEKKIVVVHNGMDHSIFQNTKKYPQIPETIGKKHILYIGSELGRKNLKNIIAAFAIFHKNHPEYVLIKAPVENTKIFREKTREYIEKNGLKIGENFFFLDKYFDAENVASLYQHADLFVFPSLKEGFGLPIIEAQACGAPTITSNIAPMSELVPDKNMTVDPENPEEIAKKMSEIIDNPALKKQFSEQWLEFVKKFTWKNTAEKIAKYF